MHATNNFQRRFEAHKSRFYRVGFTLVELMVVIGLLLLIAVMTASAINTTISGDKVRGGARQVQSFLAGARDRAIYSKTPRGVRFMLDSTNIRTVSSMVYIAPTDPWKQGVVQMQWDNNGKVTVVQGSDGSGTNAQTDWYYLYQQGLLKSGIRIQIPANKGDWYTVDTSVLSSTNNVLLLTTPYVTSGTTTATPYTAAFRPDEDGYSSPYQLELPPSVLPNQEPVLLPKGCVIHLDRCTTTGNLESLVNHGDKLPSIWKKPTTTSDPSGFDYTSMMDVMFSPRGVIIGPAAQTGIIHFYLGEQKDADLDRTYWTSTPAPTNSAPEYGPWTDTTATFPNYERGDKVVVTIFTRTGAVSSHPIHPFDRFKFAETGEVAGK